MPKFLAKILSWKSFTGLYKKPLIVLFLFCILFLTTAPLVSQAIATPIKELPILLIPGLGLPTYLGLQIAQNANKIYSAISQVDLLALPTAVLHLGNSVFNWSVSHPLQVSITDPNRNDLIRMGWTLLRDLTNMLFILGLAYIGLATALNFATFNTKKTFVNLIITALLINFTPVICGIVVDITNIIFNFLLKNPDFSTMINAFDSYNKGIDIALWSADFWIFAIYGFLTGLALLLFGILFITRPLVIWALVIFSPLAFFARSFDSTKRFFSTWWNQFFQWTFSIVPAAFMLYLSTQLIVMADNGKLYSAIPKFFASSDTTASASQTTLGHFAPFLLVAIFMHMSYVMALQMSHSFTKAAIASAKKWGKKAGATIVKKSAWFGAGAAAGGVAGGFAGAELAKQEGKSVTGGILKGIGTGIITPEGREMGKVKAGQMMETLHLRRTGETLKKRAGRAKYGERLKELEYVPEDQRRRMAESTPLTVQGTMDKALNIKKLVDDGDFMYDENQAKTMISWVKKNYPDIDIGKLSQSRPDLIHLLNQKGWGEKTQQLLPRFNNNEAAAREGAKYEMIEEQARKISPENFAKIKIDKITEIDTKNHQDPIASFRMFLGMDPGKIKKFGENANTVQKNAIKNFITQGTSEYNVFSAYARQIQNNPTDTTRLQNLVNAVVRDLNV